MLVALLVTCVADVFDPDVAEATVDVLSAGGCDVTCPSGQTCCGQPAWNAGFAADAARVASTTLAALDDALGHGHPDRPGAADAVVVPSGSCGAMVRRFWPELFDAHGTPEQAAAARRVSERTWELTELVPHLDLPPMTSAEPITVAWHHGCHLLRELRHPDAPAALDGVVGCERTEWSAQERCCGFGGLFSTTLPEVSVAMADDKLASLAAASPVPDVLVSADASCLMHLRARMDARATDPALGPAETTVDIPVRHVAQVLRDAIAGAPIEGPS